MAEWMLYGATGYTGVLLAEEAVRRGHRPLLAGRSAEKLAPLAARLGLEYSAFPLNDVFTPTGATAGMKLVLNAAGPFVHTAVPLLSACLKNGAHYLDITGEIGAFQQTFALDAQAQERGVALIPGVGFDVVPSDCLDAYVAVQIPDPVRLDVVVNAIGQSSAGTAKSLLEILAHTGSVVRRDGQLVPVDLAAGGRTFRLMNGERYALPAPWGDVETAYHTTGIPNITAYFAAPQTLAALTRPFGVLVPPLLRQGWLRRALGAVIERVVPGPDAQTRDSARCYLYARAENRAGQVAEAWMETIEAYRFTALAGIRAVERTLERAPVGALTPARAFGADFVLEIEGTVRKDTLPR